MKILEVTKEVPVEATARGHHEHIWEKVRTLKNGEWLPVECKDDTEARLIAAGAYNVKDHFIARKRLKIVYLSKRTA